jgi:3-deoxy-D-manno-octulosonate 8-phosphate phosphatase (KDO 8-P phosphatase)
MNTELEWFKKCLKNKELIKKLEKIKLVVSDVDGAQTDGRIYFPEGDGEVKGFSVQDGFLTSRSGDLKIAFLSGRNSKSTKKRAVNLKIPNELCKQGCSKDKIPTIKEMQIFANATKKETLHFGDDVLDLNVLPAVELFVCPQNALFYVKHFANFIIPRSGGHGAFRLLLDLILFVQNKHLAQQQIKEAIGN